MKYLWNQILLIALFIYSTNVFGQESLTISKEEVETTLKAMKLKYEDIKYDEITSTFMIYRFYEDSSLKSIRELTFKKKANKNLCVKEALLQAYELDRYKYTLYINQQLGAKATNYKDIFGYPVYRIDLEHGGETFGFYYVLSLRDSDNDGEIDTMVETYYSDILEFKSK